MTPPTSPDHLRFRVASGEDEFRQIHALNHRVFAEEIPQHPKDPDGLLVDPFHDENTYIVGLIRNRVVAMVALRDQRPFSLDRKLADLDTLLPPDRFMVEIRLLAVEPDYRGKVRVFRGLIENVVAFARSRHWDLAIISGTVRQRRLYRHLGFVPFGPEVGEPQARFQPMFLTLESFRCQVPWVGS
ncbi:MAG: GNAT family N-acetyltransferase [Verrucomicrobiota bacterium]